MGKCAKQDISPIAFVDGRGFFVPCVRYQSFHSKAGDYLECLRYFLSLFVSEYFFSLLLVVARFKCTYIFLNLWIHGQVRRKREKARLRKRETLCRSRANAGKRWKIIKISHYLVTINISILMEFIPNKLHKSVAQWWLKRIFYATYKYFEHKLIDFKALNSVINTIK